MTNLIKGRNDAPKSPLEIARHKLEFMTLMIACGRDKEATQSYGDAIEILNKLIEKEKAND